MPTSDLGKRFVRARVWPGVCVCVCVCVHPQSCVSGVWCASCVDKPRCSLWNCFKLAFVAKYSLVECSRKISYLRICDFFKLFWPFNDGHPPLTGFVISSMNGDVEYPEGNPEGLRILRESLRKVQVSSGEDKVPAKLSSSSSGTHLKIFHGPCATPKQLQTWLSTDRCCTELGNCGFSVFFYSEKAFFII